VKKPRLPELPDTGRRYLDDTLHARLASPGVERFPRARREGRRVAVLALLALAAILAAMVAWISR